MPTTRIRCWFAPLLFIIAATNPRVTQAQGSATTADSYPARCGAAVALNEGGSYVPLPRGDVFCPLVADPKAMRSFATYQRGGASDFARDIGAVGIGDHFAFFRAGSGPSGNGVQFGASGAVFAQFDLDTPSFDLVNADYIIGFPLTFRVNAFSGRLRFYHQSSHLGDEFLLRPDPPERENLSFEATELLLSYDLRAFRVYGGGEYFFRRDPITLPERLLHGGIELRPRLRTVFGPLAVARPLAAVDVKFIEDSSWRTGVSVRAGFEFSRPNESQIRARRWSILGEFYDGPSPYGQFLRSKVRLTGVGLHFSL